ncbi:MAG: cupin domain-containing protein [Oscillospiraceae bacterium]|nr:cupin domain-containing protein [Oscillospiraceae bacterium]
MSYKVTRKEDAYEYEGRGHFNCYCVRLHDPQDVNEGCIVHGITHFLPGGGSNPAKVEFQMIYHTLSGEMTVTLSDEDGKEEVVVMKPGDSVYFGKGTTRSLKNNGTETAQMMTIMVRPQ